MQVLGVVSALYLAISGSLLTVWVMGKLSTPFKAKIVISPKMLFDSSDISRVDSSKRWIETFF